jgi:hypothetical protein
MHETDGKGEAFRTVHRMARDPKDLGHTEAPSIYKPGPSPTVNENPN